MPETWSNLPGHEGHEVELVRPYVGPDDPPEAGEPYLFCRTCNEDISHLPGGRPYRTDLPVGQGADYDA